MSATRDGGPAKLQAFWKASLRVEELFSNEGVGSVAAEPRRSMQNMCTETADDRFFAVQLRRHAQSSMPHTRPSRRCRSMRTERHSELV